MAADRPPLTRLVLHDEPGPPGTVLHELRPWRRGRTPRRGAALDTERGTWLRLAHDIALNGRVTVLTGSFLPSQLEPLPGRKLIGPIHFCTLDSPDDVIAERLRSRPSWRGASAETVITEHQRFAAWLRTHIQPCYDTSVLSPAETAGQIAAWVRQNLASTGPEGQDGDGDR